MAAPNLEDPLDEAIADHWRKNQAGALKTAREWTINYANQWDIIEVVNIRADKWLSGNEHLTKGHFLLSIVYKLSYVFLVIISVKFIHFFEILLLFDSWDCWARIQYYYSKFDRLNLRNLRKKKTQLKILYGSLNHKHQSATHQFDCVQLFHNQIGFSVWYFLFTL